MASKKIMLAELTADAKRAVEYLAKELPTFDPLDSRKAMELAIYGIAVHRALVQISQISHHLSRKNDRRTNDYEPEPETDEEPPAT